MLQQKAHKGPIRIDTPPPYARSDGRSAGSHRWGAGQSSAGGADNLPGASIYHLKPNSSRAHSQKFNYSRTKTLHHDAAKSSENDSSDLSSINNNLIQKQND